MAPEEIQLNKPLWEAGSGGRPQHPREKRGAGPPAPPTPPPVFGGFWVRLMALTVDLLTIVILHNLFARLGLDDVLYTIAPWCPLIGIAAMLVMLVVLPTRIWPGQTLGKRLLKLRVVTQDFEDPPLRAHLKRFVMIAAVFIPGWLDAGPLALREWLIAHPTAMGVMHGLVFSLVMTEISLFIIHPAKRGFHDLWAGTYVIRLDAADPHPAHALALMGDRGEMRIRQARRMAFLMFPLLAIILAAQLGREPESPLTEMRREVRGQLVELAGPTSGIGHQVIYPLASPEATQTTRPSPEGWLLIVQLPHTLELPWSDVQESEEGRALATRALDLAEREYDPGTLPNPPLADLPLVGSVAIIAESYAVIPGIARMGGLAAEQRAAFWNRQYVLLSRFEGGLLPGAQLIPFNPSPEVTASPASE